MTVHDINLLPSARWNYSTVAYLLRWVTKYGNYVLVFTELIVILAFLSRFKLDQDLADLSDKLNNNRVILESSQAFEKKVSDLTKKQNLIIKEWQKQPLWSKYIETINQLLPEGVVLNSIEFSGHQITVAGNSTDEASLSYLITSLKRDQAFKKVVVDRVSSDVSFGTIKLITFIIKLDIRPIYVKYHS